MVRTRARRRSCCSSERAPESGCRPERGTNPRALAVAVPGVETAASDGTEEDAGGGGDTSNWAMSWSTAVLSTTGCRRRHHHASRTAAPTANTTTATTATTSAAVATELPEGGDEVVGGRGVVVPGIPLGGTATTTDEVVVDVSGVVAAAVPVCARDDVGEVGNGGGVNVCATVGVDATAVVVPAAVVACVLPGDGCVAGCAVGIRVGHGVGGIVVGNGVGHGDGIALGATVGRDVGTRVGNDVGCRVGCDVGAYVMVEQSTGRTSYTHRWPTAPLSVTTTRSTCPGE